MNRVLPFFLFLLMVPSAWGQGVRYDNIVFNQLGQPVTGATVAVCEWTANTAVLPCDHPAVIYQDPELKQPLMNPTSTVAGNFGFWLPPGNYKVQIYGAGVNYRLLEISIPCTPTAMVRCGGAGGDVAIEPSGNQDIQYVTAEGSDLNDGFSWGHAKRTFTAAINGLKTDGGTIFYSGTITITSTLVVGLLNPARSIAVVGMPGSMIIEQITDRGDGIVLINGSSWSCLAQGSYLSALSTGGGGGCKVFTGNASVHIRYMFDSHVKGQQFTTISGMTIVPAQGTIEAAVHFDGQQPSVFQNNLIEAECGRTHYLLSLQGGEILAINNWLNAGGCPGITPMYVANYPPAATGEFSFVGGAIEHPGLGLPLLVIQGDPNATGTIGLRQLHFTDVHFEGSSGAAKPPYLISIHNGWDVEFKNDQFTGDATRAMVHVYGAANTSYVVFQNVGLAYDTTPAFINDEVSGRTFPWPTNLTTSTSGAVRLLTYAVAGNTSGFPLFALSGPNGVSAKNATLSSGSYTWTFATAYSAAPVCVASDTSNTNAVRVETASTTSVKVDGTGNDGVNIICTPAVN